jgi:LPS export ABC transporter protein LptC
MIFRILVTLLLVAIIGGSFWLGGQQRETVPLTTVEASSADLGYSARNAVLVETGADGLPMYTLNASVIHQHPGDAVEFDQVQMTFRDAEGQTWKGRADHGELTTDSGIVDLAGNVHVDGLLPGSAQVADLATQKLSIDTHESILSTEEPVTLNSTRRVLKARGLVATLKEHHLVLESNIHGTFSP